MHIAFTRCASFFRKSNVLFPQRRKGLDRIRSLRSAPSAIQKTELQILDLPNWAAVQKSGKRLFHFLGIVMLRKVIRSLAHEKHNCRIRKVQMARVMGAVYLLVGCNNRF